MEDKEYVDVKDVIPKECHHDQVPKGTKFFYCWVCRKYYDLVDGKYEPRIRKPND